jgi:hypothetical protein
MEGQTTGSVLAAIRRSGNDKRVMKILSRNHPVPAAR